MTDQDRVHELDLTVGSMFTTRPEEDRDLYEQEQEWISSIQDLLREEGVEVDLLSRPGVEVWESGIERFADLYQLRLLAAYLEHGRDVAPLLGPDFDLDDEPDPLLAQIWESEISTRYPHLLNHQAEGGYYLPVDFAEPIWLEYDAEEEDADDDVSDRVVSFGSSPGLQRELVELAPILQQAGVSPDAPAFRCLTVLQQASEQSIANDLPIIIW